tara:strand:+ start:58 stop:243 length:186 start_codon:yes stop_codon:yes gene_type:complete
MPTIKEPVKKQSPKRVEVFTKKYCDRNGNMHSVGEVCTITDEDELAHLTERNALKAKVIKV